ncbi:hypothetical protein G9A89_020212 [Geosiphon pyriformis]|nr:hypothetical protein G9A89_020212 [Geosiphon pyriformis]
MSFTEFKNALLEYFNDPNIIIQLQNEFNTIKQSTGETVTQYLARFNQIHCQIEMIEQGYYTNPQVLNQFIRGLKSSILGRVHSAHPNSLSEAITLTKALESAEKEANHSQIVNIVIKNNKTETLKKKVAQLGEKLFKKMESYLISDPERNNTYQTLQRHNQEFSSSQNNCLSHQDFKTETRTCHFCKCIEHLIGQCQMNLPAITSDSKSKLASRVLKPANISEAALDKECSITAMYMEAKVNNTLIKLILDSGSAGSIVTLQLVNQLGFKVDRATTFQIITADRSTKLLYGKIDTFPFEINGIIIPTKVLVMDATQYQTLVENDWLTKANTTLDWTTQKLFISYNSHHARIPVTCGHFQKPSTNQRPTFEFEKNPALPVIKTYQLSWADDQRTGLPAKIQIEPDKSMKKPPAMQIKARMLKTPPITIVTVVTKKNTVIQKDMENGIKNHCQKSKGGTCDATCQYTILICDWVRGRMSFEAVFNRAVRRLQHYPHDEDELYNTAQAKWTNSRTTTNNYVPLDKSKNNTSLKSTLTSAKTVLFHAKINAVKSVKTKGT